jgi:hypothetical protein
MGVCGKKVAASVFLVALDSPWLANVLATAPSSSLSLVEWQLRGI